MPDQPPNTIPNTIPWPPLLYGAAVLAALLLHLIAPLPWVTGAVSVAALMLGILLVAIAVAVELATALTFRRHKTTILPHRPASALITTGPFALSRNPIYTANTMLLAGAGLIFGIAWLLPAAALAAILTHHLAVLREEKHLEAKFGNAWTAYARKTPRWLGLRQK
jgi:protein-S-isoprenylcysteine O-methyltransferase Ste14